MLFFLVSDQEFDVRNKFLLMFTKIRPQIHFYHVPEIIPIVLVVCFLSQGETGLDGDPGELGTMGEKVRNNNKIFYMSMVLLRILPFAFDKN